MSIEIPITSNLLMKVELLRLYRPEDESYQDISGLVREADDFHLIEKLEGGMAISFSVPSGISPSFPTNRYYNVCMNLGAHGFSWRYNIRGCWVTFEDQYLYAQQHGTSHEWWLKRPNGDILRLH